MASLHPAAWQRLFDEVFVRYPSGAAFTEADYLRYVDGRRRTDGVAAVLPARRIELPAHASDNHPDRETMSGLASRKHDYYYLALLHERGPRAFASSVVLVRAIRHHGVARAVVSSSRHCAEVPWRADAIEQFLALSRRQNRPMSLAILDLDHFKQVNDQHRHATGDCPREAAITRLNHFRATLADRNFTGADGGPFHLNFSNGVAETLRDGIELDELQRLADAALYRARHSAAANVPWPTVRRAIRTPAA